MINVRLALFCSGSGSNAEAIMDYFKTHSIIKVSLVVVNKQDAGAVQRAKKFGVPSLVISSRELLEADGLLNSSLQSYGITHIVLAGFLRKIPHWLIEAYPKKIINIHPSLLPKYGGKGMYGLRVHEAVVLAGEQESGLTIHEVNEEYDQGDIIFQASIPLEKEWKAEKVASEILRLEHYHFPRVIERWVCEKPR